MDAVQVALPAVVLRKKTFSAAARANGGVAECYLPLPRKITDFRKAAATPPLGLPADA